MFTCTLHQSHETLALDDLDGAVQRALVLNGLTRCHHHTSPDRINWIGNQTGCNGHNWKEEEYEYSISGSDQAIHVTNKCPYQEASTCTRPASTQPKGIPHTYTHTHTQSCTHSHTHTPNESTHEEVLTQLPQ